MSSWLRQVAKFREQAKIGPLHRLEFKMLELFAKHGVPGAEELLGKRKQIGTKKRKAFRKIVQETPRLEGEPSGDWVRRIRAECTKYESMPTVITEELLERYSRRVDKRHKENLPAAPSENTKSFRSAEGDAGNSANMKGRRDDAVV
jgi:Txe/YoeB family toxin of Txe-Axe toxin-antitoxin module